MEMNFQTSFKQAFGLKKFCSINTFNGVNKSIESLPKNSILSAKVNTLKTKGGS